MKRVLFNSNEVFDSITHETDSHGATDIEVMLVDVTACPRAGSQALSGPGVPFAHLWRIIV